MKTRFLSIGTVFLALILGGWLHAQKVVVQMATVAPRDSLWHNLLEEMGDEWRKASGGQVRLRVFPGTMGDEPDIVRKMGIGQLQAAALSTVGLGAIDTATQALHIPLAFESHEEVDYVMDRLAPRLEKVLEERGYVVLNWGEVGWLRFFSKSPVVRPDDLRKQKMFLWNTDAKSEGIWRRLGFQPVPLGSTDILPALQTNMIGAVANAPIFHLAGQWFALTGYMTDMLWAPLTGATVISKSTWEKIPAEHRPKLMQIARETGERLKQEVRKMERDAIQAMVKRGVKVVKVPPDALREWKILAESQYPTIRRELIPSEYFDMVMGLRNEYRTSGRAGGPAVGR